MATLGRKNLRIVDDEGNVVPNATVTVRHQVSGLPLASIFSDRAGLIPLGNPFTADANGRAPFHAVGGAYQIEATDGVFSETIDYEPVGTAAENDFPSLSDFIYNPVNFGAVGDGVTDDTAFVLAAATAANAAGGGTVIIPSGYTFATSLVDLTGFANVTILGRGGVMKPKVGASGAFQVANSTNIRISNVRFDASSLSGGTFPSLILDFPIGGAQSTSVGLMIDNCVCTNLGQNTGNGCSFALLLSTQATVTRNRIYCRNDHTSADAISCDYGDFIITENYVEYCGDGAYALNGQASGIIANNRARLCQAMVGLGTANGATTIVVIGNKADICNIGVNAGYFGGTGDAPTNVVMSNNTFRHTKGNAIKCNAAAGTSLVYWVITGNVIDTPGSSDYDGSAGTGNGIFLSATNGVVSGNLIYNPVGDGIDVEGNGWAVTGNAIIGAGSTGIYVLGNNNLINDNLLTGTYGDAIQIDTASSGATVDGNYIAATATNGIRLKGTNGRCASNRISGTITTMINQTGSGWVGTDISTTFSLLPAANTVKAGTRAFITDSNTATFHATAAGSGSNKVPVVGDGTNWLVG